MQRKTCLLIILFLLSFLLNLYAGETKWFSYMPYAKPFVSNVRSDYNGVEVGMANKVSRYYYLEKDNYYPYFTANFSVNFPFFEKNNGYTRWGIEIPFHTTTFMDMFDNQSAPLLNNDYIVGLYLKMIRYVNNPVIHNIAFRFCPLFHESSHIGDEFLAHGSEKVAGFKRINFSYNAWEFFMILNDPDTLKKNVFSFSLGISGLLDKASGYYSFDSIEVQNQKIYSSDRMMEYFLGINWQRIEGFLCSNKWKNIISLGINNRSLFNYEVDKRERRVWSIQLMAGYELNKWAEHIKIANYLKYYYGLNPHGMFRNEYDYSYFGLATVLRFL